MGSFLHCCYIQDQLYVVSYISNKVFVYVACSQELTESQFQTESLPCCAAISNSLIVVLDDRHEAYVQELSKLCVQAPWKRISFFPELNLSPDLRVPAGAAADEGLLASVTKGGLLRICDVLTGTPIAVEMRLGTDLGSLLGGGVRPFSLHLYRNQELGEVQLAVILERQGALIMSFGMHQVTHVALLRAALSQQNYSLALAHWRHVSPVEVLDILLEVNLDMESENLDYQGNYAVQIYRQCFEGKPLIISFKPGQNIGMLQVLVVIIGRHLRSQPEQWSAVAKTLFNILLSIKKFELAFTIASLTCDKLLLHTLLQHIQVVKELEYLQQELFCQLQLKSMRESTQCLSLSENHQIINTIFEQPIEDSEGEWVEIQ